MVSSWTASGRKLRTTIASPASPKRTTRRRSGPDGRDRASATSNAPMIGSIVTPSTWHCIVIAVPTPASSHQRGSRVDHARQAPASAMALDSAMRFGFQMNVDSSTAEVETAIATPATRPATGPPIDRASHHVTRTAAIPASAMSAVTASGESPPVRNAAGESR